MPAVAAVAGKVSPSDFFILINGLIDKSNRFSNENLFDLYCFYFFIFITLLQAEVLASFAGKGGGGGGGGGGTI